MSVATPDDVSRRELIRERAREMSEFNFSDLTDDLIREGLFGMTRHLSGEVFRFFRKGAMEYVRQAIKASKLNNGCREFYALEEGEKARWKCWAHMTRRMSREVYLFLKRKLGQARQELRLFRTAHKERFGEDPDDFEMTS